MDKPKRLKAAGNVTDKKMPENIFCQLRRMKMKLSK